MWDLADDGSSNGEKRKCGWEIWRARWRNLLRVTAAHARGLLRKGLGAET